AQTRARDQRARLRWAGATAASYAVDTGFLALFAAVGVIGAAAPIAYGVGAAIISIATWAATASGVNLRFRNPNLTGPLMASAVALQLVAVALAPPIAFPFLANLFTVFAFGMLWLSPRQSFVVWSLGALALGGLVYAVGDRFGVPVATPYERTLVWLYFSLILGRCLALSVQASDLRRRLAEGRHRLAESLEQMRQLASHDELTLSLNRRSLMARLEQERSRIERGGEGFSVALFDLDHFKDVNDTHGHAVGDDVLRAFAKTAHGAMRDTDAFGRYGGEEFMLILGGTPPPAALAAVERVRAAFAARDWSEFAPGLRVTASAGIAGYRRGETVSQLLSRADSALYEAKRAGRDRAVIREGTAA
ncbi:MAG: GGDEF domain-containing protein, partial [Burkholderiales bacterium]